MITPEGELLLYTAQENHEMHERCGMSKIMDHPAIQCLKRTTPGLNLIYPMDAHAHFREIHRVMQPFLQGSQIHKFHNYAGYEGPRIENHWITTFYEEQLKVLENRTMCLSDLYGPFIPLFIPWVDLFVEDWKLYERTIETIRTVLRKDVPYITVSQNDEGLTHLLPLDQYPNILVLSAGGYGHVPVPLLNDEQAQQNQLVPVQNRPIFVNYVGKLENAPRDMRPIMNETLTKLGETIANRLVPPQTKLYQYAYGENWRSIMANSFLSLCPRGFGRTAFHILEALHMGHIPIQIYSDTPWIPYADLLLYDNDPLVYATTVENVSSLVDQLQQSLTVEDIIRKEARIVSLRESHFLPAGIMAHIKALMLGEVEKTDLVCQKLPATVLDDGPKRHRESWLQDVKGFLQNLNVNYI